MKKLAWAAARLALIGFIAARSIRGPAIQPRLAITPAHLRANGYDVAMISFDSDSAAPPRITLDNPHAGRIEEVERTGHGWQARLRAGFMPGAFTVRAGQVTAALQIEADNTDSIGDGIPDYLRLDDPRDREAFRRWFTFLAEAQYFQAPEARPAEIDDCAALIRYAYREALRAHDSAWATAAHLPVTPAFDSVGKYQYPYTALGADLFRVPGGFAQFADVKTLEGWNTYPVARDLSRALPGDLLFFRQDADQMPYHSMIFAGPSRIAGDRVSYVVYHTGPPQGEIRRLSADALLHYPEPDWRPIAANPYFLGVYRWNILRETP
ncbi:MAG TPA: DUF1175 family protein [Verrucomicrobiae bacterium]|nr:DUF1175 family protein [Verrucomicrobiae bacterium]